MDRVKVDGRYTFDATPAEVWALLLDPAALRACMPGCTKFEPLGDEEFDVTLELGVAGIKGTYNGGARIADRNEGTSYKLIVEGSGTAGFVRGEGLLTLEPDGDGTTVIVSGDANAGGMIANLGQRMLGGVAKMVVSQFFDCLRARLAADVAR
jgi:carbon monoxide dehydrogenase subunit G